MREKEPSTILMFVRHGRTDFSTDRIYCDALEDPPLNADGVRQAAAAATYLSEIAPDALVSSPVRRTSMTAEIIARETGLEVQADGRLRERCFGLWEGLFFDEIMRKFPADYRAWKRDKSAYTPDGGESIESVKDRVDAAVRDIVDAWRGKTVVVVSHVGPIRVAIASAIGLPTANYRTLTIGYGAISRIDYGSSQSNLVVLNHAPGLV